jgi:hypothetical protein
MAVVAGASKRYLPVWLNFDICRSCGEVSLDTRLTEPDDHLSRAALHRALNELLYFPLFDSTRLAAHQISVLRRDS